MWIQLVFSHRCKMCGLTCFWLTDLESHLRKEHDIEEEGDMMLWLLRGFHGIDGHVYDDYDDVGPTLRDNYRLNRRIKTKSSARSFKLDLTIQPQDNTFEVDVTVKGDTTSDIRNLQVSIRLIGADGSEMANLLTGQTIAQLRPPPPSTRGPVVGQACFQEIRIGTLDTARFRVSLDRIACEGDGSTEDKLCSVDSEDLDNLKLLDCPRRGAKGFSGEDKRLEHVRRDHGKRKRRRTDKDNSRDGSSSNVVKG